MLFNCPHCKAKCQFDQVQSDQKCEADGLYQSPWACQNCKGFIVTKRPYTTSWNNTQILPLIKIQPKIIISKLPENIKSDYIESLEDYSSGCYISCVIMCRRAIQQSCLDKLDKDKEIKKKNLYDQIEELDIDNNLKQIARKLRFWGNGGAHPDILLDETISEQDAKLAIDFTEKFLQYVYIIPKELEEIESQMQTDSSE